MNRDQKAAVIEEIAADITASQAIFAIDYRGISVAQADTLRARLREADAVFRVVKNSLTERAAEQAGAPELMPLLQGPTALTFVRGDAAAAAKAVADFTRATQLLAFKGGLMDGAALSGADVTAISRLPSREVLYGQLVGLIANPLAGLARTLNALIGGLAVGLGGVLSQKQDDPAFAVSPAPVSDSSTTENATLEGEAAVTDQVEGEGAAEEEAPPAEAAEPAAADSAAAPAEEAAPAEAAEEAAAAEPEAAAAPEAAGTEVEAAEADSTSPDKDQGDALAESDESAPEAAAETEAEATAETETDDGSAPEPAAGDDEKE
jgi:large subunit ribosomal protein L10